MKTQSSKKSLFRRVHKAAGGRIKVKIEMKCSFLCLSLSKNYTTEAGEGYYLIKININTIIVLLILKPKI